MNNVRDLLREAAETLEQSGSETPRLDAELLLGHAVGAGRTTLLAAPEAIVSDGQAERFRALVERRARGEPVAYVRGIKEFYGIALSVDPRALIPRPETELLVELGLVRIQNRLVDELRPTGDALLVWDIGTGSGAVCIALAVECRRRGYGADVHFRATDASTDALALAVENAVGHGVADQIDFAVANLTADLNADAPAHGPADLILANLPYIPSGVIPTLPIAASFEPVAALDGGADGLAIIERLLSELPDALAERGEALLEIGSEQDRAVEAAVARTLPDWHVTIRNDLAGRPRVASISRPA